MNTNRIIDELKAERDCIERAIVAIGVLNSTGHRRTKRPSRTATRSRRSRMSAAARRKLSRLMKQRWAQGKMKPKTKAIPAQALKPARRVSRAARKRMAAAQRARWAKVRAQQQAQKKAA